MVFGGVLPDQFPVALPLPAVLPVPVFESAAGGWADLIGAFV
ncbi:MAG: hypothetical protein R3E96_12900 [Planctomycetota bacterium]